MGQFNVLLRVSICIQQTMPQCGSGAEALPTSKCADCLLRPTACCTCQGPACSWTHLLRGCHCLCSACYVQGARCAPQHAHCAYVSRVEQETQKRKTETAVRKELKQSASPVKLGLVGAGRGSRREPESRISAEHTHTRHTMYTQFAQHTEYSMSHRRVSGQRRDCGQAGGQGQSAAWPRPSLPCPSLLSPASPASAFIAAVGSDVAQS